MGEELGINGKRPGGQLVCISGANVIPAGHYHGMIDGGLLIEI